ncbi:MAG: HEPN domain-containing protein [Bacteroidetes bacterium]|nr:HEPN domain-containing protein [Bacteroidota bacterium]
MTIDEQIEYWITTAENDLPVAENLFNNGHYLWCLYLGHLILEKIIKAHYVKDNRQTPPKTHDLLKLSEKTKIALTENHKLFLDEMNDYQLETRYPDYKFSLQKSLDVDSTRQKFNPECSLEKKKFC